MEEIEIPDHPDYTRNQRKIKGTAYPCIVCGKGIPIPKYTLHIHHGGSHAVTEERAAQLDPAADLGCYPVGVDCLRKHPELKPFARKAIS